MSSGRDDDLDWLYGRERTPRDEPEPTRVFGSDPQRPGADRPRPSYGGQPTAQQPPVDAQGRPAGAVSGSARQQRRAASQQGGPYGPAGPGGPGGPSNPGGPGRGPNGPGAAGAAGPSPVRKRKHPVRRFFGVLGVVVALCLVWLIGVPVYAWSQIARVDNDPSGSRPGDQPGYTFLLLGSDSRAGLTKAERKKLGTGNSAGQRTDTIMILYVPSTSAGGIHISRKKAAEISC